MNDPIINSAALKQPRNRQLLIIIGGAVLVLVIALAVWQSTGTQGAKRDLSSANDKVVRKQAEVDDARRMLEQKLAELRAVRAEAAAQATKLGSVVDERLEGMINDARVDVPVDPTTLDARRSDDGSRREYYIRDRDGRFIRVERP